MGSLRRVRGANSFGRTATNSAMAKCRTIRKKHLAECRHCRATNTFTVAQISGLVIGIIRAGSLRELIAEGATGIARHDGLVATKARVRIESLDQGIIAVA